MIDAVDFFISAVRYEPTQQLISYVAAGVPPLMSNETLMDAKVYERKELIRLVRDGKRFVVVRREGNQWRMGERVHAYEIDGEWYLRTDGQLTPGDNLGQIAEYLE
jgi:hypothetical protein